MIVAIEGIDGAGKDTLIDKLIGDKEFSKKIKAYKKYTDNKMGESIIKYLMSDNIDSLLLSGAFLCELINISDELTLNDHVDELVLLNRWVYSTIVYGSDDKETTDYLKKFLKFITKPDLAIYLDIEPELAFDRISGRTRNNDSYENIENLIKVKNKYNDVFKDSEIMSITRLHTVSITQDKTPDDVYEEVRNIIRKSLP